MQNRNPIKCSFLIGWLIRPAVNGYVEDFLVFKVINKVANTLSIDVNTTVFDGKVTGNLSLFNISEIPADVIPTPPMFLHGSIYTEPFSLEVLSTDNLEAVVKAAAAQQLGVTYL